MTARAVRLTKPLINTLLQLGVNAAAQEALTASAVFVGEHAGKPLKRFW
jgi:hypothetical protein